MSRMLMESYPSPYSGGKRKMRTLRVMLPIMNFTYILPNWRKRFSNAFMTLVKYKETRPQKIPNRIVAGTLLTV